VTSTVANPSPGAEPPVATAPHTESGGHDRGSGGLPYVGLGVVLLLWGLGPPLSKLITLPPLTASFTRLWTSSVAMVAMQAARGVRPSRRVMRGAVVGGVAFGFNSVVFFYAIANASIATITVIGALQPALVMFGAWRLFGERITRWGVGWTGVAIVGALVAVLGAGAAVHSNAVGVACSVGSLLCMGVYFLASKAARATLGAGEYVMGVMLWASLVATPVVAIGGGLAHLDEIDRFDWLWVVVMLIGPGVGGQLLMGWAVRYVPVSRSAMILLGSTVVSILAAWPIHGQRPTLFQVVGCAITLGAVGAILQRRR
jgi:drug/metabolite transporter (DMT)-like permease